jgi:hypothetical protein
MDGANRDKRLFSNPLIEIIDNTGRADRAGRRQSECSNFAPFRPKNCDYFQIQKTSRIRRNSLAFSMAFYQNSTVCFDTIRGWAHIETETVQTGFHPERVPFLIADRRHIRYFTGETPC